jgi:hypothetical protein
MPMMTMRVSEKERDDIKAKAIEHGFGSVSAYIKFACINAQLYVKIPRTTHKEQQHKEK